MLFSKLSRDKSLVDQVVQLLRENWDVQSVSFSEEHLNELGDEKDAYVMLDEGNHVVAHLFCEVEERECYLSFVCVRRSARRKGFAKDLIAHVFEQRKTDLVVECEEELKEFYEKLSFVVEGRSKDGLIKMRRPWKA